MLSWLTQSDLIADTWHWNFLPLSNGIEEQSPFPLIQLISEKYCVNVKMTIHELLAAIGEESFGF